MASEEDVNAAFGKDIALKPPSIRDAWIIDIGCAPHICNTAARYVQMEKNTLDHH
jgi:hypothetical protein